MNEENGSEPQYVAKFPKTSQKPEKGWRSSLAFGASTRKETPESNKKTPDKGFAKPLPEIKNKLPSNKNRKPISPIGKRTKQRLKENGSETDMFREIWNERPHICEICSAPISEPKPECFSHRLGKGRYPNLRYVKKNITLVCSMECHHENDIRNAGNDLQLIREILS